MLPKKGNKLPRARRGSNESLDFNGAIALALRRELGSTHPAVKTVMHWTGASESAVKTWLAGSHGPSGTHLMHLLYHSDEVLQTVLALSNRSMSLSAAKAAEIRIHLMAAIACLDDEE